MPTGIARWKSKLFITIPRWKKGVPSTLNYIPLNCVQNCPLHPYPSWRDGYLPDSASNINSNATIVSTFRIHVDSCDRLWVVDNGVADMANEVKQITMPAIVVYNLNVNMLDERYELHDDVIMDSSVLTSIVVDVNKNCRDAYAYITDMGSNAIVVYSLSRKDSWRVEHPFFSFDPFAGSYKVGGVEFYWNDGVSSAALTGAKKDGYRNLYVHPTSSTKQFKLSTKVLKQKNVEPEDIIDAVEVVGDRGPNTQSTACDYDPCTNVLFYTQLNKNGVGCWNLDKPFHGDNVHVLVSDCTLMEFPNDVKVDADCNVWILSDRQSRFLYNTMNYSDVNYRIMSAPACMLIQGTTCENSKSRFSLKRSVRDFIN
ncbi:L-dopachrome tautomerase yellow-f2-like [Hyposmocoma kahamanoa]|uniref:L-dopachrome tautomerase yellow-f2-like n=1 Tax=Hyposmocoma kahamanoa TaxID=1477025 RepID=UPI000E6D6C1D|nr:L-dopachrome tautomerase yellow-f2-like [Hyposmocoma kahamanoa]